MKKFLGSPMLLASSIVALSLSTSCNNKAGSPAAVSNNGTAPSGRIAYINVDTLQSKYTFWKTEADALTAEQAKIESEIQSAAQKLQNDYAAFQQKAQSGNISEAEGRSTQQRLAQMQQSLESRRTSLGEQLQARQIAFSETLQKNIDEYLAVYNKDNKYDYILSYTKAGQILYANKAFDITDEIVKGLNDFKPSTASDSSKSK